MEYPARLDVYVSEEKDTGRNTAQDIIKKGCVTVNGKVVLKPGFKIAENDNVLIEHNEEIYVSRGGVKLEAALDAFAVNLDGLVCADIGASTGGFTDLMLKRGASKIYAIDSGSNQLAEVLRNNNRVISLENTDIRDINNSDIPGVDFLSVDVSFISLSKIICVLYKVLKDDSFGVILIKPQFEAGPGVVNKKGVIKNPKIHYKTLIDVYNYTVTTGFAFIGLILSPITGRDGNREFLGLIRKAEAEKGLTKDSFSRLAESLLK